MQLSNVKMKIIVVGGGLGGLATAIALARRGHDVTVLEQAQQLGEVRTYSGEQCMNPEDLKC